MDRLHSRPKPMLLMLKTSTRNEQRSFGRRAAHEMGQTINKGLCGEECCTHTCYFISIYTARRQ